VAYGGLHFNDRHGAAMTCGESMGKPQPHRPRRNATASSGEAVPWSYGVPFIRPNPADASTFGGAAHRDHCRSLARGHSGIENVEIPSLRLRHVWHTGPIGYRTRDNRHVGSSHLRRASLVPVRFGRIADEMLELLTGEIARHHLPLDQRPEGGRIADLTRCRQRRPAPPSRRHRQFAAAPTFRPARAPDARCRHREPPIAAGVSTLSSAYR
jgi:hypothetical protein